MALEIYHNPRCSKSRQALSLIEEKGIEPVVVEYLETPPDAATLARILDLLGMEPRGLLRKQEAEYQELALDNPGLSREALIQAMVEHPNLIERPIVIKDGVRAALGRPPELIQELL